MAKKIEHNGILFPTDSDNGAMLARARNVSENIIENGMPARITFSSTYPGEICVIPQGTATTLTRARVFGACMSDTIGVNVVGTFVIGGRISNLWVVANVEEGDWLEMHDSASFIGVCQVTSTQNMCGFAIADGTYTGGTKGQVVAWVLPWRV